MILRRSFNVIVITLSVSIISKVNGLKCWQCSSDGLNNIMCADPFEPDLMTELQRKESFVQCYEPNNNLFNKRAVCVKHNMEIYGNIVTTRSCGYENFDDSSDQCYYKDVPAYFTTTFCETCTIDGCNSALNVVPEILTILLPIIMLKYLLV